MNSEPTPASVYPARGHIPSSAPLCNISDLYALSIWRLGALLLAWYNTQFTGFGFICCSVTREYIAIALDTNTSKEFRTATISGIEFQGIHLHVVRHQGARMVDLQKSVLIIQGTNLFWTRRTAFSIPTAAASTC